MSTLTQTLRSHFDIQERPSLVVAWITAQVFVYWHGLGFVWHLLLRALT